MESGLNLKGRKEIQRLLNWLYLNPDVKISPSHTPHGYEYPEVRKFQLKNPVEVLEALAEAGILKRTFYDQVLSCPKCSSSAFQVRYLCPFCGSPNVERGQVIEHYACGHVDFEENFYSLGGELKCPLCGEKLNLIGVDYRRVGKAYKCVSCGRHISHVSLRLKCLTCGHLFNEEDGELRKIYIYTLAEGAKPALMELMPLTPLVNFISSLGLEVLMPGELVGTSGLKHTFDLVVKGRESTFPVKFVIDIAFDPVEVDEDSLLSLFAKSIDVKGVKPILIAIPKLSKKAKETAEVYNVEVIEGTDIKDIKARLNLILGGWKLRSKRAKSAVKPSTELNRLEEVLASLKHFSKHHTTKRLLEELEHYLKTP